MKRVHGFRPDAEGEQRAEAANRELLDKAAERAGALKRETETRRFSDEWPAQPQPESTTGMRRLTPSSILGYLQKLTNR